MGQCVQGAGPMVEEPTADATVPPAERPVAENPVDEQAGAGQEEIDRDGSAQESR